MRQPHAAVIFVAVILAIIGSNEFFRAEAVEHHGFKVKYWGSRSECLSCHDESVAKGPPPCMPVCDLGKFHPFTKEYPPQNRKNEFKPVEAATQAGVQFSDGRPDCISCHNLLNSGQYHLRIGKGKTLCNACHVK